MTDQERQIATAEACGWKDIRNRFDQTKRDFVIVGISPQIKSICELLPDYLNDLNAMHEAEKTLTPAEWEVYPDRLWGVLQTEKESFVLLHATSRQRNEAFLRVKGLWKD